MHRGNGKSKKVVPRGHGQEGGHLIKVLAHPPHVGSCLQRVPCKQNNCRSAAQNVIVMGACMAAGALPSKGKLAGRLGSLQLARCGEPPSPAQKDAGKGRPSNSWPGAGALTTTADAPTTPWPALHTPSLSIPWLGSYRQSQDRRLVQQH